MTGLVSGMLTNFKKIIIWSNFIDFKQKFLSSFYPLPPSGYFFNLKAKGMFCTYPTEDFFVKLISCIPWTVLGNKIIWIFLAETCKIGLKDCSGPDPVLLGFSDWYAWYWGAKRPASPHRADCSSELWANSLFAGLPHGEHHSAASAEQGARSQTPPGNTNIIKSCA